MVLAGYQNLRRCRGRLLHVPFQRTGCSFLEVLAWKCRRRRINYRKLSPLYKFLCCWTSSSCAWSPYPCMRQLALFPLQAHLFRHLLARKQLQLWFLELFWVLFRLAARSVLTLLLISPFPLVIQEFLKFHDFHAFLFQVCFQHDYQIV